MKPERTGQIDKQKGTSTMTNIEIIRKYTAGELTLAEANLKLRGIRLNPGKNILTEEEKRATTVGYYPEQANGWGLLDTGTGTLDKVEVRNGKLVNCDMGCAFALVLIAGKKYEVKGAVLVEA
jgi:hypothetical protein